MKFDEAPRLSKIPFLLGNLGLLALAWFIYAFHPNPFSPFPLFIIFVCFVGGILASMYPFVINYVRDQADASTSLRHELDEQFKRLVAASEHLQNSILQLKSIGEVSAKAVEAAERLPARLQERVADFNQQLAATENKEKARLEQELARLRAGDSERQAAVAAQITAALAEWTKTEADARLSLAGMVQREKESLEQQAATLRAIDGERQAAATAQITTALAEWTKIEADARLNLADMVQREKKAFEQQSAAMRSADIERHASATTQIATSLAEWTRIEANARQSLADMMQQEKESFEQQSATLRTFDNERHAAASSQIANALAEWTKIEADARRSFADMVQWEKKLFEQQMVALRSSENERLAAAAEEITMTLASWTGIEAGVRRQLTDAATLHEKLAGVLSALDDRIADLQRAVESATKAAEAIPTVQPPPAIMLPMQSPAEVTPIVAAPEPAVSVVEAPMTLPSEPTSPDATIEPAPAQPPAAVEAEPMTPVVQAPEPVFTPAAASQPALAEPSAAVEPVETTTEAGPSAPEVVTEDPPPAAPMPVEAADVTTEPEAPTPVPSAEVPPQSAPPEPPARVEVPAIPDEPAAPEPVVIAEVAPLPSLPEQTGPVEAKELEAVEAPPIPSEAATPEPVVIPEVAPPPATSEPATVVTADEEASAQEEPRETSSSDVATQMTPPPVVEQQSELLEEAQTEEPPDADSPATDQDDTEPTASPSQPSDPAAPPKPQKPRAPRKPKHESTETVGALPLVSAPAQESTTSRRKPLELIAEPVVDEPPAPDDFSQVPPEEKMPAANRSADGRTRLTVTSYIGIGNKLHLRGEGAGLSWGKGVPLQFVSIGRWRWETDKATEPVTCKIYKNDKLEAPTGLLTILPGTENEVSATF